MDIDGWLRGIGLAQYAEMFRANDIDGEMLGRLTNDDLKDIGVASFGHRTKLLEAIAEEEARSQVATLQDKHVTNAAVVIVQRDRLRAQAPRHGSNIAIHGALSKRD